MVVNEEMTNLLIDEGYITKRQLERALREKERTGEDIDRILIRFGFVTEKELTQVMGQYLNVEFVDLEEMELDMDLAKIIPEHLVKRYKVVPLAQQGDKLTLAMVDPSNVMAIDDIRLITGFYVKPVIATEKSINDIIGRMYGVTDIQEAEEAIKGIDEADFADIEMLEDEEDLSLDKLRELVDEAPIVRMVNILISQAINDGASDIHIEPLAKAVKVKYRIDGVLHEMMSPPKHIHAPMVSRIKIMAKLDIAERRVPQDGKIHLKHDNKDYDLRVSTVPTVHGEKVVMRILDKTSVMLGLDKLGFYPDVRERLEDLVVKPYGMILVTGPTGSGKSTTLYACLNKINTGEKNIMTVEDPVEYQIDGINQVQVNEKAGLHFATALRAFLRQDPDVIMVGEIRDRETAKTAVEAALTGHLVLSTLHTNDAPSAVTRLIEMGVEPFLVASSVIGVLAQRLARKICPNCKEPYIPEPETIKDFNLLEYAKGEEITLYKGRGCNHCRNSGYKGRTGIHELMIMDNNIKPLVLKRASSDEIKEVAVKQSGMRTLQDDALSKVLDGITSLEEALRVVFIG